MAKSKAQWFETLKAWVPSWFWEVSKYNQAVFTASAKVLSVEQVAMEEQVSQTFILQADGESLDLHGNERGVPRITGETDAQYRVRIQSRSLVSQVSKPDLLAIVNQFLIRGMAYIKEDFEGGVFADRESFANRAEVIIEPIYNTFSIVVDQQIHVPYSFANREAFCGRENFIGTTESSEFVFEVILNAVNDNKAFGVFFRILERLQ